MDPRFAQELPPNRLAWRQAVAGYWSISWPASLAVEILVFSTPTNWLIGKIGDLNTNLLLIIQASAFLLLQAILCRRLVGKNYRTFRVEILRKDRPPGRVLSRREHLHLAARILWPQISFLCVCALGLVLQIRAIRPWAACFPFLLFLAIGPAAVRISVCSNYRGFPETNGFRLQSYALRFI